MSALDALTVSPSDRLTGGAGHHPAAADWSGAAQRLRDRRKEVQTGAAEDGLRNVGEESLMINLVSLEAPKNGNFLPGY